MGLIFGLHRTEVPPNQPRMLRFRAERKWGINLVVIVDACHLYTLKCFASADAVTRAMKNHEFGRKSFRIADMHKLF